MTTPAPRAGRNLPAAIAVAVALASLIILSLVIRREGFVLLAGAAGERFGVRNSGATAVAEGIGMCETQANEYFQIGDDGIVEVATSDVPESDRTYVRAAVDSCPVSALRMLD